MPKYSVSITVTDCYHVKVVADDPAEAEEIAYDKWYDNSGDYYLDSVGPDVVDIVEVEDA